MTRVLGGVGLVVGPPLFPDTIADAIVDAETGCLLRLISYSGDTLVIWSELDDISTEPAHRTSSGCTSRPASAPWRKPETGSPTRSRIMPGLAGTAARAAAEAVSRTTGAVSAAPKLPGRPARPSLD